MCKMNQQTHIHMLMTMSSISFVDRETEVEKFRDCCSRLLLVLTPAQGAAERGSGSRAYPTSLGPSLRCSSEAPLAPH